MLNLSKNSIESIQPLKKMKKLRIVHLGDNCLTNVDAFHNCGELVKLSLEGNMLKGLDQLRAIKTCPNLQNLHLMTLAADAQNPICQLNGYRQNLFAEFPNVKRLDGIFFMTQGSLLELIFRRGLR